MAETLIQKFNRIFSRIISAMSRNKKDNALAAAQSKLQKEIAKIFIKQGKLFIEQFDVFQIRFKESITGDELNRLFNNVEAITNESFIDPLNTAYQSSLFQGANEISKLLGEDVISFNLSNQRANDWIIDNGAKLVTNVNETTRFRIKTVVRNGVKEGLSYDKIAANITKRYKEFAIGKPQLHIRSRAHLVAITETGNAYEAGAREGAKQANDAGLTMEKKWSTTGDNRVSELCLVNEDESWIGLDQVFASGHDRPLRFPGCRCAALYRRRKTN
ncbi:MAG: phage minor head protein [Ignavibacteriaceae bacterium]